MARPKSDVFVRFQKKVRIMDTGCHEWQATLDRGGYGKFYFEGEQLGAHRVAYRLFVGDITERNVLHSCDNRKCVNPKHLFLGTLQDNIKDMDTKGRRGTRSRLTYADVGEIRKLLDLRYSQEEIAARFGVDQTTISKIKLGKTTLFRD